MRSPDVECHSHNPVVVVLHCKASIVPVMLGSGFAGTINSSLDNHYTGSPGSWSVRLGRIRPKDFACFRVHSLLSMETVADGLRAGIDLQRLLTEKDSQQCVTIALRSENESGKIVVALPLYFLAYTVQLARWDTLPSLERCT